MTSLAWLWIPFTLMGAAGQVVRNAMQRGLTAELGTLGATHVRFLFGFPFALLFLFVLIGATGDRLSWPEAGFWPWLVTGGMAQILATALMLMAMNERSFVVTTAYLKTEAIQTAIFGFLFLADRLTALKVAAILIATAGVVVTALRPDGIKGFGGLRPTLLGLLAAAFFALSAVGYRGAILNVGGVSFVTAASLTLVATLLMQTVVQSGWLVARSPAPRPRSSAGGSRRCSRASGRVRVAVLVFAFALTARPTWDAGAGGGVVREASRLRHEAAASPRGAGGTR